MIIQTASETVNKAWTLVEHIKLTMLPAGSLEFYYFMPKILVKS